MEEDVDDWIYDVWDQSDEDDFYDDSDEEVKNIESELREDEDEWRRYERRETLKALKYFSRYLNRVWDGRSKTQADLENERIAKTWNIFSNSPQTTVEDNFLFSLRRKQLAKYSTFGLLVPPYDDMVFELKPDSRRTQLVLFNCLFRIDFFSADHIEEFRSCVIEERLEEISRKKASRKAHRKRHHRRGKGNSNQDVKKGNLTNSCISVKKTKKTKKTAPTGTLAGSPPPSGSDSLGLSSFEDRNSSQTTSQVSFTDRKSVV